MNAENAAVVNDSMDVELDSAWGDDDGGFEAAEQPETEPMTEETPAEENEPQEPEKVENTANQPELFTLKNKILGDRQVTKEEYDAFAQKGYDYDRVQQERDQLREYKKAADPAYAMVKDYANRAGFGDNVAAYLDFCREQELKQSGKTEAEAKNIIAQEKREADLTAREAAIAQKEKAQNDAAEKERLAAQKQEESIKAFFQAYPDVSPKNIPKEVWERVATTGEDLTTAYTMYENKRLMAELAAERKNKENKASAPGSLTANAVSEQDDIDRIWDEDDY